MILKTQLLFITLLVQQILCADIILEGGATHAAGGKAKLRAVAQNRMVFPCPWRATKTLYAAGGGTLDTAYLYREEFNVSSLADGTFSLNLAGLGSEFTFPVGSGALQSQCDAKKLCSKQW